MHWREGKKERKNKKIVVKSGSAELSRMGEGQECRTNKQTKKNGESTSLHWNQRIRQSWYSAAAAAAAAAGTTGSSKEQ